MTAGIRLTSREILMRSSKPKAPFLAFAAVVFFTGLFPVAASAQSPELAQWKAYIGDRCKTELKKFCKSVPGGDGRLVACLYSHDKALSPKCGTAVMASLDRLNGAIKALADAQRICEPDAKRLCNGVIAGDGNLIGCLARARAKVSPACNATLDEALLRP